MERVLKEMMQSHAKGLYIAIPATVISFDAETQRGKVSIDVLEQIGDKYEAIAPLEDVPFAFLRSGGFVITFPINKGDKVQLLFQHRSIDKWLIDGAKDAKDTRNHSVNDAIASNLIAYPLSDSIKELNEDYLVIRSLSNLVQVKVGNEDIELNVKDNSTVKIEDAKITMKTTKIILDADVEITGKLTVEGVIKSLTDVLAKTISLLKHLHSGVLPGPSKTSIPE